MSTLGGSFVLSDFWGGRYCSFLLAFLGTGEGAVPCVGWSVAARQEESLTQRRGVLPAGGSSSRGKPEGCWLIRAASAS